MPISEVSLRFHLLPSYDTHQFCFLNLILKETLVFAACFFESGVTRAGVLDRFGCLVGGGVNLSGPLAI